MEINKQTYDIKLKEYEENMNTYRYLADMNAKYFMFFLVVASFALKIYVDADEKIMPLLILISIIGAYVSYSIFLVYKRMSELGVLINITAKELGMNVQNFKPFLNFLVVTIFVVVTTTLLVLVGMYNYHLTVVSP